MGKRISVFQIDAFTKIPFQGNPAAVTLGDDLTNEEMQSIAKEMNLAETAFLSKTNKADYNLRWFTPATEVDLCGHATIASMHFLYEQNLIQDNSTIKFDTRSGILKCRMENGKYFMQIPLYDAKEFNGSKDEIIDALGIDKSKITDSIPFIILENEYLYIYVEDLTTLKKIRPDFKALLNVSATNNSIKDFAVFTLTTFELENFAHLRFFAPYHGIDEDPVTGSANGPLLLVLKKLGFIKDLKHDTSFTFEQGDIIGRPGRVTVKYFAKENELYISGHAVTVLKGELFF